MSGGDGSEFSVGITPWLDDWDGVADTLVRQGSEAESMGFHSFWLPESHFSGRSSNPAPLLRLAALAARTERIALGTTSYLLPVRHPIQVAEEVAVLDRLSRGRVILGVGRGFRSALFAAFDVPRAEKRDRFEAAVEVMRNAWRGMPVARDPESGGEGPTAVVLAPLPLQQPHPPVWVAAFGPKALEQAGRLGLPYFASPIETLESLEKNYARHREALPEGGAAGLPVPVIRSVFCSRDVATLARAHAALKRQAAALARASLGSLRRNVGAEVDDWAVVGEPAAVADRLALYRERLGMTHLVVRAHLPGVEQRDLDASVELVAETLL